MQDLLLLKVLRVRVVNARHVKTAVHAIPVAQEQVNIHSIRSAPLIRIGLAAKVTPLAVRARVALIMLPSWPQILQT
jgi:hypothetical protein